MLTKEDLQAIRLAFKEEFRAEFKDEFGPEFKEASKPLARGIKEIQKTLDATIRLFDNDVSSLNKRVTRVGDHLKLPPTN